ncbi:hypothetical protein AGRA3207_001743 [Actinomadura graeca]|uniref:Uncharacterized protein n=1 Tax=Actinomadura graeca TaxID=2750812 RepID=A0ABX8QQN4_9ACTN|nr:hypothetical protein [Actinomadura graeca]QXJ20943.1 hypothetical protein AGRA3207_001743 [Actinomadura graeca]
MGVSWVSSAEETQAAVARIEREFSGVVAWYGRATGAWWAMVRVCEHVRLVEAVGARRLHLAALDAVIGGAGGALTCGLVGGPAGLPVLRVGRRGAGSVEVGCEPVGGRWWFVLVGSGQGVVPVDEVDQAPAVLGSLIDRATGRAGRGAR